MPYHSGFCYKSGQIFIEPKTPSWCSISEELECEGVPGHGAEMASPKAVVTLKAVELTDPKRILIT